MKHYKLYPAWYYTAPGLAWDAVLKITEAEFELLSDVDMLRMTQRGTRGGINAVSTRFGRANNKYMGDKHNPSKPSKYIAYLDANNIYGWAMTRPLPKVGLNG